MTEETPTEEAPTGEPTEHLVELGGKNYQYGKSVDGLAYTFDGWHSQAATLLEAYAVAKEGGTLIDVSSQDQTEGFEIWLLDLVKRIQELKDGESFKVVRQEGTVLVLQEKCVMGISASEIANVGLRMEGGGS